ncbi:histidine-rich glycoprotein-like [Aricia agestis]|uniref:histidine-rich glycoprotein-like n=1 Tax=Aricia agestis TaxID=91739 RepID=UPI001C20A040|nr:histidine-rich glycoprotein-like [Aricia agestis]XP_041971695.1 histidine-rich glycoprotein-like [Aricia agestis]
MRAFVLISLLLVLHTASATPSLDKITEKVHAGLKHLTQKAAIKLHKLSEEIDLHKIQQHIVHAAKAHKHYIHEHHVKKPLIDQHQVEKLKLYFEPHHHHKPAPVHFHHVDHIHH